jgi:hypothetical protein
MFGSAIHPEKVSWRGTLHVIPESVDLAKYRYCSVPDKYSSQMAKRFGEPSRRARLFVP